MYRSHPPFVFTMDTFDTERFIVEIEKRPSIWDSSTTDYANRNVKIKCWEELVDLFGGKDLKIPEKRELGYSLQKRWKSIRGCYTREISRKKSIKSGSGAGSRKSEYTYFRQLRFLQNVVAGRECTSSPEPVEHLHDNDVPLHRAVKRRKKNEKSMTPDDVVIKVLNDAVGRIDAREMFEQDEDRLFLLSLLNTLKRVPQDKKMATKIKMMTFLDEATQGSAHENAL